MAKKKTDETGEVVETAETQAVETPAEDAAAAAETEAKPKRSAKRSTDDAEAAKAATDDENASGRAAKGKRSERIGVVASDKMTKTVVVRVDRVVKHPVYRKYVRKRKKFMAHDELGSKIGDKVRIVETRPLSARKRWRVVEIIQKAQL